MVRRTTPLYSGKAVQGSPLRGLPFLCSRFLRFHGAVFSTSAPVSGMVCLPDGRKRQKEEQGDETRELRALPGRRGLRRDALWRRGRLGGRGAGPPQHPPRHRGRYSGGCSGVHHPGEQLLQAAGHRRPGGLRRHLGWRHLHRGDRHGRPLCAGTAGRPVPGPGGDGPPHQRPASGGGRGRAGLGRGPDGGGPGAGGGGCGQPGLPASASGASCAIPGPCALGKTWA